jgi:YhcH/YjgK/YiaL family protein
MIADSLARPTTSYELLHPLFARAFDYLRTFDRTTPDGKVVLDPDKLVALPQSYATAPAAGKRFEAHRRFIDIQFILEGEEIIEHAPIEWLPEVTEPYSDERDVMFFRDPAACSRTLLRAGDFAVYFPADGHKPCCQAGTSPAAVRKVVMKIAVGA